MKLFMLLATLTLFTFGQRKDYQTSLNELAEQYVRLMLDIGQHDPDFIDAYHGPQEWMESSKKMKHHLTALMDRADAVAKRLRSVRVPRKDAQSLLRKTYLQKQLIAATTRIEMMMGKKFSFDEEAKRLYDVRPPSYSAKYFDGILKKFSASLPPGKGSIQERYSAFKQQFIIPKEKLDTIFTAAILECRTRTARYIKLPDNERFDFEFVTDKAWSGYNWYQGDAKSLIQVNVDLPIFIDRAVDLAAHEGYPGHHVYNVLLESELLKKNGWIEFCVYPLFSPQSLIAEGSANYGVDIVLPGNERTEFEKRVLFPLAGIDTSMADRYYAVESLKSKLAYAGNEAARGYLNGTMTKDQTVSWLTTYALFDSARAVQRVKFIEKYRSYVINYNLGQDLVRAYVEKKSGKRPTAEKRWEVFEALISSPRLPGGL